MNNPEKDGDLPSPTASAQRIKLPVNPSVEHLQKQAKRRCKQDPTLKLAQSQHQLAKAYGCKNWAELVRIVETMRRGSDQLHDVELRHEPLPRAADDVDIEAVRRILEAGNFTQLDLDQALAHACWYERHGTWEDRKAIAELLVAHGADPDGQYGSNYGPIIFGTGECLNLNGLQFLIDAGADVTFPSIDTKYGRQCALSPVLGTYSRGANSRKHRMIDLLLKHNAFVPPEVTPSILAIHRGDAAELSRLLKREPGLLRQRFATMPFGNIELKGASLLHCAVEFGERACMEALFEQVADINIKADILDGIGGQTPIYHAIATFGDGNFETLEYLSVRVRPWVDMGVRATWRHSYDGVQSEPMTPLQYAEFSSKQSGAKWRSKIEQELVILRSLDNTEQLKAALLRKDAPAANRILDEHPETLSPLLWPTAIYQAKSVEMTRLLLDRGLNPDECTAPRKPLHLAVYQCLPAIVELLIERGADVNLRNPLDETPLDLLDAYEPRAVGDPDAERIRRALRAAGAKDDFYSHIRAGDAEQARKLLEADPSLANLDSGLGGPLFVAARSGRPEIVSLLLEFGADPNHVNTSKGNTPLWFAAQSPAKPAANRIECMKILLEAGADLHRRCEQGSTALHFAAWRGPLEVVEFLRGRGAESWLGDDAGKLPVDYAYESNVTPDKAEIIKLLTRIRILNPDFRAAVDAIDAGEVEKLRDLLSQNPQLLEMRAEEAGEFGGEYFTNPVLLHFVANNPYRRGLMPPRILESTAAILDAGADVDALTLSTASPSTTLALVASCEPARKAGQQIPMIELLVSRGANPNLAMQAALEHGEIAAVEALIRLGASHNLTSAAMTGDLAPLREFVKSSQPLDLIHAAHAAAGCGRIESIRILVEAGVPIDARSKKHPFSSTLLHDAAWDGQSETVEWLLKQGADPCLRDTRFDATPAGWAEHNQHPELAKLLKESEEIARSRTIVDAVIHNDLGSLRRILNADREKIAETGGVWNKPLLHNAAWEGHLEIVQELVRRGFDVNQRCESDHAGAIHFAAEKGFLEIVEFLAEAGADLEAPDNDHQLNVLGWATSLGECRENVAHFLLERGVTLSIWSAIALNDAAAVRKLVAADPSILVEAKMSRNEYFRTPLHHAVDRDRPGMVRLLLELGVDPRVTDSLGLTPLVIGKANPEILELLQETGHALNLHEMLVLGRFEAGSLLASDPRCIAAGGSESKLFVFAVVGKNWPMADWLLDHGADVNAIAEVYQCPATALHFVVEQGSLEKIRWLLGRGADTRIQDGKYNADALGWAEFFGNAEAAELIRQFREV